MITNGYHFPLPTHCTHILQGLCESKYNAPKYEEYKETLNACCDIKYVYTVVLRREQSADRAMRKVANNINDDNEKWW
jgi:hypothetical protein